MNELLHQAAASLQRGKDYAGYGYPAEQSAYLRSIAESLLSIAIRLGPVADAAEQWKDKSEKSTTKGDDNA